MITKTGNLFDTDAKFIGHGVNIYGAMGAGIAVQFKNGFHEGMFKSYRAACMSDDDVPRAGEGELQPGGLHWWTDGDITVFNIASQSRPGRFAKEAWLTMGLFRAASVAHRESSTLAGQPPVKIAIPAIGCGIGGLHTDALERAIGVVEDWFFGEVVFELWFYSPNGETKVDPTPEVV